MAPYLLHVHGADTLLAQTILLDSFVYCYLEWISVLIECSGWLLLAQNVAGLLCLLRPSVLDGVRQGDWREEGESPVSQCVCVCLCTADEDFRKTPLLPH